MRKQDIEEVVFDQQLFFGFEKEKAMEQQLIVDCVESQIGKNGYVVLDDFTQYISDSHNLPDATIIQSLFWLAIDLRIHFLIDNIVTEPRRVKQLLLDSLEQRVIIVTNKDVSDSVFQSVKHLFRKISAGNALSNCDNQYLFATALAKRTRGWKDVLERHKDNARKAFFHFTRELDDSLRFIEKISTRLDSFSIINAFNDNEERIIQLSDDVNKISYFYTHHAEFWGSVISSCREIRNNVPELLKSSNMSAVLEKLEQVLSLPVVSNTVADVKMLHDQMTQQCRVMLATKIDNMIIDLQDLFEVRKTAPALRNETLYPLRSFKAGINKSADITTMISFFIDAETHVDEFEGKIET